MINGVDVSHFQGTIDFNALKAAGYDFIVIKATQGTNYVDPMFSTNRAKAHAAGLVVLLYHFGNGSDVATEASFFVRTVGTLQVGEGLVLDDEVAAINSAWAKSFCDIVFAATTVKPLVYINKSVLANQNWSAVVADNDGLWLATYDNSTAPPASGAWPAAAMKQYWDKGTVAGIPGPVDLDVFYGTVAQLENYGFIGGGNVALTQQDLDAIFNYDINGVKFRDRVFGMDNIQLPSIAKAEAAELSALGKIPTTAPTIDVDALAAKIVAATSTDEAKQVANEVVALLALHLNTTP